MHLQRIVLPSGRITWTAYDGDAVVAEIRDFVIYLEAGTMRPAPSAITPGTPSGSATISRPSARASARSRPRISTGSSGPSPRLAASSMPKPL